MNRVEWEIKSIRHWRDGTWDALILTSGRRTHDRCLSKDGFHWTTNHGGKVEETLQAALTECIGDMESQNIWFVVF